jgi:hypothetical protein
MINLFGINGFVKEKIIILSLGPFLQDELISHYGDIKRNTFFSQLINLRQKGPITEHSTIPKAQSQGKEHS